MIFAKFLFRIGCTVPRKENEWALAVSSHLKAELKRAGVTYGQLAEMLRENGWDETESSIKGKLNRGTFSAAFFGASLLAIGSILIRLDEL